MILDVLRRRRYMRSLRANKIAANLIRITLALVMKTVKIETKGLDLLIEERKKGPIVLGMWHNRIAALIGILPKLTKNLHFTAFVSQSRDGELLSQLILSYPSTDVIRVGHDSRAKALKQSIVTVKENRTILMFTPDGPRGPAYKVKPGLEILLNQSEATLIPFTWEADSYWELKTWDKFRIPKPFSKVKATFGPPLKNPSSPEIESALNNS